MSTLFNKTLDLLRSSDESYAQIARHTGLGAKWIQRLADGDYQDPGVNKIEALHEHLSGIQEQQPNHDS